jgi:peptide/nickel transport system permease protein
MLGFIIQRVLQALLVVAAMSALVFIGVYAVGNPIDVLISPDATQDIRAATIARYGLDRPLYEQYLTFIGNIFRGDMGRSFVFGMPVLQLIMQRLPATLELTLVAVLGATLLGVPLGIYAGYRPNSPVSKTIMAVSILGFSVPTFWIGLILILFFAVHLGWLPAGSRGATRPFLGIEWSVLMLDGWKHLILPALNLSLFKLAMMIRLARAGTREIMLTDTIKFARAAGLSEWTILRRHVLKLISIPIVTVFGLEFGSTLAFAVVTETIFSWPGVGKWLIEAINRRDYTVLQGGTLLIGMVVMAVNLLVDVTYGIINPRIRHMR